MLVLLLFRELCVSSIISLLQNQHFNNLTVALIGEGKWFRNIDYYRLDGSTTAQSRKKWAEEFNDETNVR